MTPTTDEIEAMAKRLDADMENYVLPANPWKAMTEAAAMLRLWVKERAQTASRIADVAAAARELLK